MANVAKEEEKKKRKKKEKEKTGTKYKNRRMMTLEAEAHVFLPIRLLVRYSARRLTQLRGNGFSLLFSSLLISF